MDSIVRVMGGHFLSFCSSGDEEIRQGLSNNDFRIVIFLQPDPGWNGIMGNKLHQWEEW